MVFTDSRPDVIVATKRECEDAIEGECRSEDFDVYCTRVASQGLCSKKVAPSKIFQQNRRCVARSTGHRRYPWHRGSYTIAEGKIVRHGTEPID